MQKRLDKYYKLLIKILKYYLTNKVEIDAIPSLKEIFDYLTSLKVKIDKTALEQSKTSVGISEAKKEIRKELIKTMMIIVSASIVLFRRLNDKENLATVNYVISELNHKSDTELSLSATKVYELMEPRKAELEPWLVEQADFDKLNESIDDFDEIVTSPTEQIENRKGDTTLLKKQLVDQAYTKITDELDPSFEAIRYKKPTLYHNYIHINVLDERGLIRHEGLQITVIDEITKLPLINATLTVEQPFVDNVAKTDKDGVVFMDLIATGKYLGLMSAEGYKDFIFEFNINRLKRTSMDIMMQKKIVV